MFERSDVLKVATKLFDYGATHSMDNGTLTFPEPAPLKGIVSLGFGRGSAGILYRLM